MRADVAVKVEPVARVRMLANGKELQDKRSVVRPRQCLDRRHVIDARPVKRELLCGQRLFLLRLVLGRDDRDAELDLRPPRCDFVPGPSSGSSSGSREFAACPPGRPATALHSFFTRPCFLASAARSWSRSSVTSHSPLRAFSVMSSTPGAFFRCSAQSSTRSGSVRSSFLAASDGGGEGKQPLLGGVNGQLAAIHRDPTPAQLLRHRRRCAASGETVENDVAWVG